MLLGRRKDRQGALQVADADLVLAARHLRAQAQWGTRYHCDTIHASHAPAF